jgi:hypothetical protein
MSFKKNAPIIYNPLFNSLYYQSFNGIAGVNPQSSDWSLFNGTGSIPYSSRGDSYPGTGYETYVTISIAPSRFLAIYGGTFGETYLAVGTYIPNAQPTFGTPVLLDSSLNPAFASTYDAVLVSPGVVYIDYTETTSTFSKYGVIATIVGNIITLNTKTQIVVAGAEPFYPANGIALYDDTHVITGYYNTGNSKLTFVSLTINGDETLTVNTPVEISEDYDFPGFGSVGMTCTSDDYLVATVLYGVDGEWTAISLPISDGGTIIGDIENSLTLSSNAARWICLSNSSGFQFFSGYIAEETGGDYYLYVIPFICQDGVFTVGAKQLIYVNESGGAYPLSFIKTNNSRKQLLLVSTTRCLQNPTTQVINCITPNGNSFSFSNRVPVNANPDSGAQYFLSKATAINPTIVMFPAVSYNSENYGISVLNATNSETIPFRIFELKAGVTPIVTTPSPPIIVDGAELTPQLFIDSFINYTQYLQTGMSITVNGTDTYTIIGIEYTGDQTILTISGFLVDNYFSSPATVTVVSSLSPTDDITFEQSDNTLAPITTNINNRPSLFFYGNFDGGRTSNLKANNVPFPISFASTIFIVLKSSDMSTYFAQGIEAENVSSLFDVKSDTVQIQEFDTTTVGSYETDDSLCLITCVRDPIGGGSKVWVNGGLNDTNSTIVSAIGNFVDFVIGTNVALETPWQGYISYVDFWCGALTEGEVDDMNREIMQYYNIVFTGEFVQLNQKNLLLLSGGNFNLLG